MFKQLEKQTYLLYFKDGIFELLFGCVFIIYAMNSLFDNYQIVQPQFVRLLIIPVTFALVLVKLLITTPRLGNVSYSKSRKKKQKLVLLVAIAAQLIVLTAYILAVKGILNGENKNRLTTFLIESFFYIILFGTIYYYTNYITFLIVGLIFTISVPLTIYLQPWLHSRNYGYAFMILSGLILVIFGIKKFIVFLKNYPNARNYEQ